MTDLELTELALYRARQRLREESPQSILGDRILEIMIEEIARVEREHRSDK